MKTKGVSRADENRRIRQEALREQLANQGHVQYVVENTVKLEDFDEDLDALKIQRLRAANETRLKLIEKYLPNLKAIEIQADITAEIKAEVDITPI